MKMHLINEKIVMDERAVECQIDKSHPCENVIVIRANERRFNFIRKDANY